MFNLARILHKHSAEVAPSAIPDLPCPDIVREPRAMLQRLNAQALIAEQGRLLAMLEGDTQAIRLNQFQTKPQEHCLSIEWPNSSDEILGKKLTLFGLWHENKVAFSAQIVQKLSLYHYLLAWPNELIESSGREYYRVHAQHKELLSIRLDGHTMSGHLYDLSEGGIGVKINTQHALPLTAQAQQWLEIHLANSTLSLHCRLHNQLVDKESGTSRLGFAFIALNAQQALMIRKIMLQLQMRQPV